MNHSQAEDLKKLFSSLELDKIFGDDIFIYFTSDIGIIKQRSETFKDFFDNSSLFESIRKIYFLLNDLVNSYELSGVSKESSLNSVLTVNRYVNFIEESYDLLKPFFKSKEMNDFFNLIKSEKENKSFIKLKENCHKITDNIKNIKSVTIGINLDVNLRPTEAGLVSVNSDTYRSGKLFDRIFSASFNEPKEFECICSLSELGRSISRDDISSLNFRLNKALDKIITKDFKGLSKECAEYTSAACQSFGLYKKTFSFYIRGVEFFNEITTKGLPVTFPKVTNNNYNIKNLYNYRIAMYKGIKETVANSICFDESTKLFVLTGPNSGGKSVFLEAIVFNQLLFQLGFPIIADSAEMSVFDNIYVYTPSKTNDKNLFGRFENEVKWFADRIKICSEKDLFIMDELFSGTSANEGNIVAFSALKMILQKNAKGIFATHLHEMAKTIALKNQESIDNLCINELYTVKRTAPKFCESMAVIIAKNYGIDIQ